MVPLNQKWNQPTSVANSAPKHRKTPPHNNSFPTNRIRSLLRARYYDTHTAEFLSPDPLEYVDGMSLFRGYFILNSIDPTGRVMVTAVCRKYSHTNSWHGSAPAYGGSAPVYNYVSLPYDTAIGGWPCPPGFDFVRWENMPKDINDIIDRWDTECECDGCDSEKLKELVNWITRRGKNTKPRRPKGLQPGDFGDPCLWWASGFYYGPEELGELGGIQTILSKNPCVKSIRVVDNVVATHSAISTGGHVGIRITLCDNSILYVDNSFGGDDHIFLPSEIPTYGFPFYWFTGPYDIHNWQLTGCTCERDPSWPPRR